MVDNKIMERIAGCLCLFVENRIVLHETHKNQWQCEEISTFYRLIVRAN